MSEPFLAEVRIWACNFAPRTWAFCDGQLLPISQNTALFSLIGTTYGGDGRTTTGLPNVQGRAVMHPGRGPGLTTRRLGERGGAPTATLNTATMPSHNHGLMGYRVKGAEGNTRDPRGSAFTRSKGGVDAYRHNVSSGTSLVTMNSAAVGNTGSGQPHNNTQPYQVMNYCIALQGLYPSRS